MFDQINHRAVRVRPIELDVPLPEEHEPISASSLRQIVRQSARVAADECSDWIAAAKQHGNEEEAWRSWSIGEAGLLRLPFDSMWIEWACGETLPKQLLDLGARMVPQMAAWIAGYEPSDWGPEGSCQEWQAMLFMQFDPGLIIYSPWPHIMFVNEGGHCLEMGMAGDPDPVHAERVMGLLATAYMAIGLMNVRNVQVTEAQGRSRPVRKRKQGTPKPVKPLVHHVITLPGTRRPRNSTEVHEVGGGQAPLHLVRGHFKTYTADAPLMGKHVGTYWWHPAVRGDHEHGVVDATYRVAPPPSS